MTHRSQQNSRISQNFKTTKAFLAGKRHRDSSTGFTSSPFKPQNPGPCKNESPPNKRIPLSDLSTNILSSVSNTTCSTKTFDYVSTNGLLDDEFDHSVFEQIDALCSAVKPQNQAPNSFARQEPESPYSTAMLQEQERNRFSHKEVPWFDTNASESNVRSVANFSNNGVIDEGIAFKHQCKNHMRNQCSGTVDGGSVGVASVLSNKDANGQSTPLERESNGLSHFSDGKVSSSKTSGREVPPCIESVLLNENAGAEKASIAESPCISSTIGSEINSSLGSVSSIKYVRDDGETLKLRDYLENGQEGLDGFLSQSKEMKNMREEYWDYLKSLNEKQREAACSDISVPLMILAGPGSGKTSTMVGRILVLLNEGISPSNIVAMTFTTAAASEMRDRIAAVTGKHVSKELTISTFHSFSLQLCRSHAEKLERTSEFLIYGHGQQRRAIIEAVRILESRTALQKDGSFLHDETSNRVITPQLFKDKAKKWQKFITQAKACGKSPAKCRKMGDEIGAEILSNYNDILKSCNALDYHDLISCSVKLLTDFPEVFKDSQDLWKAIVIDEFQDTSAMQYNLLRILSSHQKITIVGDDDQSIFSFNGADVSGFDSFRNDFPNYKEIRLDKNYRSTRYIVEAASAVIQNNMRRCQLKSVLTDNCSGSKLIIKECHNEDVQCAFVVDKILEITSTSSVAEFSYRNIAILYRRQVSGKVFQMAFRERKIPFNVHGVAFYRKKVVRAITAMLRTALSNCDDASYRRVFKALLSLDKEEKKRVIDHIEKISNTRKCSFLTAASDIFRAKLSGTFKRSQLAQGRKVLSSLDLISSLVAKEQSISAVVTYVANMIPQKYLLEQRAVIDNDGGKLLNEDNDIRCVLQYLLDDVSDFISTKFVKGAANEIHVPPRIGCMEVLKSFLDHLTNREKENFHSRRQDNENSVTLTTMHQSKGLEWDVVFIVKANESEIPLLNDFQGTAKETGALLEEERRLLYVGMTRAKKKLFILYLLMDSNWQMLQPSRFLKEIPSHLRDIQAEVGERHLQPERQDVGRGIKSDVDSRATKQGSEADVVTVDHSNVHDPEDFDEIRITADGNNFLRRFSMEERSVVSQLFHRWAKKKAFQDPKRLLDKVSFMVDERLRGKKNNHKDLLRGLKSCLNSDEAFQYAEYVSNWEQIPAEKRAHLMREKQDHFQKLRIENSMGSAEPTEKQMSYLRSLGCTTTPTSRLHASKLIEQYKSL